MIDPNTGNMLTGSAWIISAGQNGVYDTAVTDNALQVDDSGVRIK
jgi:hypothetical protein